MPRKQRPGKRRTDTIAHLSAETIAILLWGWGAMPPVDDGRHGFGGGFLQLYEANDAGIIRLWTTHREALLEVAQAWDWEPSDDIDGTAVFFGELVASGFNSRRGVKGQ